MRNNRFAIMVILTAGFVLGGIAIHHFPHHLRSISSTEPARSEASKSELVNNGDLMEIGLDGGCLSSKLNGAHFLVQVRAARIMNESENSPSYEKLVSVPRTALLGQGTITQIGIDLKEVKDAVQTDWKNLVLSVAVCQDSNGKCVGQPVFQALRLTGKYIQATQSSDKMAIRFFADKHVQGTCL